MNHQHLIAVVACLVAGTAPVASAETPAVATELCLSGELDLGVRLQGRSPVASDSYPARWCVATERGGDRVRLRTEGHINPDAREELVVSYFPPSMLRILVGGTPPEIEFQGAIVGAEARAVARIDPRRVVEELGGEPGWVVGRRPGGWVDVRYPGADAVTALRVVNNRLYSAKMLVDLPLRGRVPVIWSWRWPSGGGDPRLEVSLDGKVVFRAIATWRQLGTEEAAALWVAGDGSEPHQVPGAAWPTRVAMGVETIQDGVHLVQGVRTGFNHLVVETERGLVVADAPAGWVELARIPPADLVPGMGLSGLSERFVDFIRAQWPGKPIRAVALTHAHDDHAGGARAFAAAGARVYAPSEVSAFLESALNRKEMPADRLSAAGKRLAVDPVADRAVLADPERSVELWSLGANPHVGSALAVWVPAAKLLFVSDVHAPSSFPDQVDPARVPTECWFAGWAAANLSDGAEVLSCHDRKRTPVGLLRAFAQSPTCATEQTTE